MTGDALDRFLGQPSAARSLVCGAALRAVAVGAQFATQSISGGKAPDGVVWRYHPKLAGLDLGLVEAVVGPAATPDRHAWAEHVLDALGRAHRTDVAVVSIYEASRSIRLSKTWIKTRSGLHYVAERAITRHETIPLPDDYEAFISSLGTDTRRNIRRYRRKFESIGGRYAFIDAAPDRSATATHYRLAGANAAWPKRRRRIEAFDAFIGARARPFHATLQAEDDAVVSHVAGFRAGDAAFVVYQLNDASHAKYALATVLRAHLIETLIGQGVRELIFPNGCRGLFRQACQERKWVELALVRRNPLALAKAGVLALAAGQTKIGSALRGLTWPAAT